ncbi:M13 family metallopeptidase [Chitinimonas koreensis]|uniref:M13 family metallopeptidase n=1 Tax=Chitinimonas koreensis TaxID=356302 RepID=UPI0003F87834|nr:M13 family metallopeptidase [Chitinimonas koreensis]QNM96167.1 M13 family metallopeptidase [Chitinimonas koreensis]
MQLTRLAGAIALALPLCVFAAPKSGIVRDNFDPSVRIQDDLYAAINGGWEKRTEIPADRISWGAFHELRDLSEQRVREIVEQAASDRDDPAARQIADFYASFMDEARADQLGVAPLKPLLDQIAAAHDRAAVVRLLGQLQPAAIGLPLRVRVDQDSKDSSRYLLELRQGGLGLPDRDYYTEKDARFVAARAAYRNYLVTLFTLDGDTAAQAAKRADTVFALEAKIAKVQWSKVDNRDPEKTYNKLDRAGLKRLTAKFDWDAFLAAAGAAKVAEANLAQPSYARALATLLASEKPAAWRDYLRARALDGYAPFLSKPFVDASFVFHDQTLTGAKELRPRWKRGVALVEGGLGESVGKRYVAKYFPPAAKQKMETLVGNLLKAYAQSIDKLAWMSPATREQAHAKLANYMVKIGYPEQWRDYDALTVQAGDLVGNVQRSARFDYDYELARLGRPVDRAEWGMTPQTVNAYYNPSLNEIVFPAAILQPPFFDAEADDAVNYGGIGAVIGHEISHGFDDQGSKFDGRGNLRNWWQEQDRQAFGGLTARLVAQYGRYEPLPGRFVNGKLTLGENIADLSGLQIAYKAYRLSLEGKPAQTIDGFDDDQRFFIGFAQVWRSKTRDERALQLLTIDPHSPSHFRPIGAAVNSDAFAAAFGVKQGDRMYKPESERIRIW